MSLFNCTSSPLSNDPFDALYLEDEVNLPDHLENIIDDCCVTLGNLKFEKEYDELASLTYHIQHQLKSYILIGVNAYAIKIKGLSKKLGLTFTEFCEKHLGYQYHQINRFINASAIAIKLIKAGFTVIPKNESQCRELDKLKSNDQLFDVWSFIIDTIPEHLITAEGIKEVVNKFIDIKIEEQKEQLAIIEAQEGEYENDYYGQGKPKLTLKPIEVVKKIKRQTWLKLEELAKRYGLSAKDCLDILVDNGLDILMVYHLKT